MNPKLHLFRSKKNPSRAITVAETITGLYFLPAAQDEDLMFASIDEIEAFLDDELELLRPKKELN